MSKRSRRERRAHQQEQALAQGDVASLAKLVEESPRAAIPLLTRALGSPPADLSRANERDALAVRLCRKLRREGDPARALAVAAAGGRRTAALRSEEALAAFASGQDEVVLQIAAADEVVAAALGPLLRAVRGEVVGDSAAAPPLRALHAAARAVGHVVRGEPDQARVVVKHIPLASRASVLADEIGAAAGLHDFKRAGAALVFLHESARVPRESDVRRSMAAEATLDAAGMADLPPALAADPDLGRRVVAARLAAAPSPGTVVEILRQTSVEVFDAGERAAAALYLGFGQIRADPAMASRSFDRAIQLGADLIEALRGKLIAALAIGHAPVHGEMPRRRAMEEAARAADRLAHALERRPRAGPLAAAAGKMATLRWIDAGDARAALASIARARPLAGQKLNSALDLLEAEALALRSPADAERRLDALLEQDPGNVEAWKKRAELALEQGDVKRADGIILAAAEATRDPTLAADAREIRGDRGQLAPFEGLVPGTATAGALARELERTTTEDDEPYPLAAACRAALGPSARLAFDAAAVVITAVHGSRKMAEGRLRSAMLAWASSPRDLARLAAVAMLVDLDEAVLAASRALEKDLPALTALAEAFAVAGEGKPLGKLLQRIASHLTRAQVATFKAVAAGTHRSEIAGVPDPAQAVRELDLALAPEFGIEAFLRDSDEEDDEDLPVDLGPPGEGGILGDLFEMLGIPLEEVFSLPKEKLRRLEQKLLDIARGRPGPAMMQALLDVLNESGVPPRGMPHGSRKRR